MSRDTIKERSERNIDCKYRTVSGFVLPRPRLGVIEHQAHYLDGGKGHKGRYIPIVQSSVAMKLFGDVGRYGGRKLYKDAAWMERFMDFIKLTNLIEFIFSPLKETPIPDQRYINKQFLITVAECLSKVTESQLYNDYELLPPVGITCVNSSGKDDLFLEVQRMGKILQDYAHQNPIKSPIEIEDSVSMPPEKNRYSGVDRSFFRYKAALLSSPMAVEVLAYAAYIIFHVPDHDEIHEEIVEATTHRPG